MDVLQENVTISGSERAVVLFSGGQDSTTCLSWALENFKYVETIGFAYGQRHAIELECRLNILRKIRSFKKVWNSKLGEDTLLDLPVVGRVTNSALTSTMKISAPSSALPNTFVPGRNLLFFIMTASFIFDRNIKTIIGGMCETDYSGYPDCRNKTIKSVETTINLGLEKPFKIETPLMFLTKCQTWHLAEKLGGEKFVNLIIEDTHTCYLGNRDSYHEWGRGCGLCPACQIRKVGYKQYVKSTEK